MMHEMHSKVISNNIYLMSIHLLLYWILSIFAIFYFHVENVQTIYSYRELSKFRWNPTGLNFTTESLFSMSLSLLRFENIFSITKERLTRNRLIAKCIIFPSALQHFIKLYRRCCFQINYVFFSTGFITCIVEIAIHGGLHRKNTSQSLPCLFHIWIFFLNRDNNKLLNFMTNGTILTFPSSTFYIYVVIYHDHLHMVCMSQNSFHTLQHVMYMIIFLVEASYLQTSCWFWGFNSLV